MKKIMSSLSMLLVAVMVLSTATFAWFSINRTVEATGMGLEAMADSTVWLSKDGTAGSFWNGLDFESDIATVFPVSSKNGKDGTFFVANPKYINDLGNTVEGKTSVIGTTGNQIAFPGDASLNSEFTGVLAYKDYVMYLRAAARNEHAESVYAVISMRYTGSQSENYLSSLRYALLIEEEYVKVETFTVPSGADASSFTDKNGVAFPAGTVVTKTADGHYQSVAVVTVTEDDITAGTYASVSGVVAGDQVVKDAADHWMKAEIGCITVTSADETNAVYSNFRAGDVIRKNTDHTVVSYGVGASSVISNRAYVRTTESYRPVLLHTVTEGESAQVGGTFYGLTAGTQYVMDGDRPLTSGAEAVTVAAYLADHTDVLYLEAGADYTSAVTRDVVTVGASDCTYSHGGKNTLIVEKTDVMVSVRENITVFDASSPLLRVAAGAESTVKVTLRVWIDGEHEGVSSSNFKELSSDYVISATFTIDRP